MLTALAQRSDLVASVVGASRDCVKLMDPDGTVRFINPHARKILDLADLADVLGHPWPQLWPKASQSLISAAIARAAKGAQVRFEAFCPTARGREAYWDISISPVRDRSGTIIQLLAISREITTRITLEESVREREAEIEALRQRLAERSRA
ncbi:hypothetical protein GCM10007148_15610 [Parvularcula lutaonensis]|nr:hypothetical protein GCM10007148_15610 [Parvularcula lutaonensis]